MKLNSKEKRIVAVTITIWGLFLIGCGIIMNSTEKPLIITKYDVKINEKQVSETQAKIIEIKLKDLEIEINTPLSVDIKDYLENYKDLKEDTIKNLKLDTALVNISEAGTYQYTIYYNKKKYMGNIIVKEKELPNVQFTLKEIRIKKGEVLSGNKRDFINEEISDEVCDNMKLNINPDYTNNPGEYIYTIVYKNVTYKGKIIVEDIEEPEKDKDKEKEKDPIQVIEPTPTPTPSPSNAPDE